MKSTKRLLIAHMADYIYNRCLFSKPDKTYICWGTVLLSRSKTLSDILQNKANNICNTIKQNNASVSLTIWKKAY